MINKYAITSEIYEEIPAFIDGVWTTISYNSREEFVLDLEQNYFKEVGEYNLTEDAHKVLEVRKIKLKTGEYCDESYNTAKYVEFWDFEKLKSRKGVFIHSGENKWYFSRDLYFWWNFLPIFNKKKKVDQFPDLIDAHIRMDLYELIAELKYKHSVITKKRQFGSSYYHMAKLINRFWFEPSVVLQMGASLEKYIDDKDGCWKYINSYKNYLNKETAWFRHIDGGAKGPWQQKKKEIDPITKQETESGRMGTLGAFTFERSATNGVGGPKTIFYHEESGIAPKMDTTYGFISPALEDGVYTTGSFIAAGSVGDLTQCEPLKKYMYSPEQNNFYGVLNKWVGENEPAIITGLYIAEFHGMAGFVDPWGNSLVEEAFAYLKELKEKYAVEKTPEDYALFCSQKPTYLNEAFKYRGESSYPTLLLQSEELRLTTEEKVYEVLDTEYDPDDEKGQNILLIPTTRVPISVFPLSPLTKDKSGAVVIFERPIQNLQPLVTYYASVDPVGQGKTLTSKSLASIYIYRRLHMVTRVVNGIEETVEEGDKIVATWCGRYDDIEDTHEEIIKLILLYKAWTLVENNVSLLIDEMKRRNLQKFLVPKKQFQFGTEFQSQTQGQFFEYGWRNTGDIFSRVLESYLIKWLSKVIYKELDADGNVVKIYRGVRRLKDVMAIREMLAYYKGLNVDRIVTLAALITFVELQEAHKRGALAHVHQEDVTEKLQIQNKLTILSNKQIFSNLGNKKVSTQSRGKSIFKKLK